jgi:Fic family protein
MRDSRQNADAETQEGTLQTSPTVWLAEHAVGRSPVFLRKDIPEETLRALEAADLILSLPATVVVLRSPGDDADGVIRTTIWSIVQKIAEHYAPAVVERDSAVRLHLGRTDPGPEIRIRQSGQTRWQKEVVPGIVIRVERGPVPASSEVTIGEATIPVDPPERVLLSLPLNFLRSDQGLKEVALWLKSLTLSRPAVVEAYREDPRPVVLKRIADIAADIGNTRLADMLNDVIAAEQNVRIGRDRTGVGRHIVVPGAIASLPTTNQPWLDRLRLMIVESRTSAGAVIGKYAPSASPRRTLDNLLHTAREAKAYDAYHSSSIEGYRLRLEEVSSLLGGSPTGARIEDVASRLAVIGYGMAFDKLLNQLSTKAADLRLSTALALDLYTDLFTPSVEAGLVEARALRTWRTSPVYIRNTVFVPPNPDKVPAMMDLLFQQLEEIPASEGYLRAILVHMWFVWIHPFPDGNGRVARFLMNAALMSAGEPWFTIRVDQRAPYFDALKAAQVSEEYVPFSEFVVSGAVAAQSSR